MSLIGNLAEFVSSTDIPALSPYVLTHTKMHTLDTVGAMLAGPQTAEGVTIGKFVESFDDQEIHPAIGYWFRTSLFHAALAQCAATRSTEIDDIHLESCTTPGSVVIPTAFSLAAAGHFEKCADLLSGIVTGYELLIRMGLAIDGPRVLYQGIWPTYMAAPLAAAAVASRALKLDDRTTAHALAIALTMSTGVSGRITSPLSSRWITLGTAVEQGILAAFAASAGFAGDDQLLDKDSGPLQEIIKAKEKLLKPSNAEFLITRTALKPYPSSRQALAAIEAFKEILSLEGIDPISIDEIVVHVPNVYAAMIANPSFPATRQESLLGVRYQMALAAFHSEILFDVNRDLLPDDREVAGLLSKVHVKGSDELDKLFPAKWPAKVEVRCGDRTFVRELLSPVWDSAADLGWEEIDAKFMRVAGPIIGRVEADGIVQSIHGLDPSQSVRPFIGLLYDSLSMVDRMEERHVD